MEAKRGIVADFMTQLSVIPKVRKRLFCFFGSTLGNLLKEDAALFLKKLSSVMEPDESFILGIDLVKDKRILENAYNDSKNITEKFNKNILNVINNLKKKHSIQRIHINLPYNGLRLLPNLAHSYWKKTLQMKMTGFLSLFFGRKIMSKLSGIRSNFPILQKKVYNKHLVYLDNAATMQKPKCVIDSIVNFYTHSNSNIHRGGHYLSEKSSILYEQAREFVAEFLHAPDVSEIIFTSGTTESINLVVTSFGESFLNKGDEVVISEMEHHSNIIPWQRICEQKKCILRVIPIENDGSLSIDKIKETLCAKTKIMAICHVSNVLGTINSIKEIVNLAHAQGIPVLVDGAQAVQHLPVDLKDLDADFYAFSGHKVYAPTEIGVLYGKKKWLSKMPPYKSGGGMVSSVSIDKTTF